MNTHMLKKNAHIYTARPLTRQSARTWDESAITNAAKRATRQDVYSNIICQFYYAQIPNNSNSLSIAQ